MKIGITMIVFLIISTGFGVADNLKNIDAVSGASKINHYKRSSLKGDALLELIKKREAAFVLATTNPDDSPNAAVFIPGIESEKILKFGMAMNQTRLNIERTGKAVLTVYRLDKEKKQSQRHQGARLVLELVKERPDKEKKQKKYSLLKMKIIKELPLG